MSALTEALVAAQAELPTAIGRDSQGQGYRYTSFDALDAATRPILTKHGIAIVQQPTYVQVGETLRPLLRTILRHIGGEYLVFDTPLILNEPKSMMSLGAAITHARRYAWAAALGIASEEDTDAATIDDDSVPF